MGGEERVGPRQTKTRLIAPEKGQKPMTPRQIMTTALGTSLLVAGAFAMSGCGGEAGQPARGSISVPRKSGAVSTIGEKVKPKAAAGGKLRGKGGL